MTEADISSSLEDYLEAIAELTESSNGHAHTKDIAERLKVKMPSVTNALRQLASRGLVHYESHAPVVLTPEGQDKAAAIRRRHALLESFFRNILKVEEKTASAAACKIEHVIDETSLTRLAALATAIEERADCAGLRGYLAEHMPSLLAEEPIFYTLDQLPVGQPALVVKLEDQLPGIKKLAVMGLIKNVRLEVEGHAPFGDLLRVRLLGSSITLRLGDARGILVRPC